MQAFFLKLGAMSVQLGVGGGGYKITKSTKPQKSTGLAQKRYSTKLLLPKNQELLKEVAFP